MVLPKRLARFNRHVTNRLSGLIAPWMPGFGVVLHTGRRSGRSFRTPLNVFRQPDGFLIALTYGPDTDWVKNVLAADGCSLLTRGRVHVLKAPRIYRDEGRGQMPAFVRIVLRLNDVNEFMHLTEVSPGD
jgi:deazaflavin-dependent oxidoreductase (nitroreductase family)